MEALMGGLGLVGSSIGSFMSAQSSQSSAAQMRKILERQAAQNRQMVGQMTLAEQAEAAKQVRLAEREMAQVTSMGKQAAARAAMAVFGSPSYQAQAAFLQDVFQNPIPESLATDVAGRLRTAQAARGLEGGGAPAMDEANLLANMAFQARQQLLPQMRQLAYDPYELQFNAQQQSMQLQQAAQQSGLAQLQAYMGARNTAQGIAQAQYGPLMQANSQLAASQPVSAANPWANMLGTLGGGLTGLAGMLSKSAASAAPNAPIAGGLVAIPGQTNAMGEFNNSFI